MQQVLSNLPCPSESPFVGPMKVKLDFQLHDPTDDEDFISACEENDVNEVEPKTCEKGRQCLILFVFVKGTGSVFSRQIEVM